MVVWAGIDPGERRIGVARSDALGLLALPRKIVTNEGELIRLLEEWVTAESLGGVVVGLPRNMDGSLGPIAARSIELARRLRQALPLDIVLWDERLTTQQVEKTQPKGRSVTEIDDRVAALILQTFLDAGCPRVPDPPENREGLPPRSEPVP